MTLSVNPSSSFVFLAESSQYFGRTSVSWHNIRICDNSSIKMTKVTLFFIFIRSVYTTMGFVSPILLETTELQNNNVTFSFAFIFTQHVMIMLLNDYNFKRFLACMIFLTTRSVLFFLPGNRSMAWIILVSAFHLSCKFLARL